MNDSKTILVSGATGLVGRALCQRLEARGDRVKRLSRSGDEVTWDIKTGWLDGSALDGVDAVMHLAGEPIAQRWTESVKDEIMKSRVDGTALLAKAISDQDEPPAFICASGSNFYGYNCGDGMTENSPLGEGFLASVCREWEAAASVRNVRTVWIRTGMVLSKRGGALAKMALPFKLGLGGKVGTGDQLMSWVSLTDLVSMYLFALDNSDLSGPINAVAPMVATNLDFTETLGRLLNRPTILPVPEFAINILFGEMGKETILANVGLVPERLLELGFHWEHANLEDALAACFS